MGERTTGPPVPELTLLDMGGTGPTLLLLHANGIPSACYALLAQQLHPWFHVLALDAPGQGATPAPPGWAPTPEGLARAVAASVAAHGLRGACVLAHSMGGWLALMVEAMRPGTFSAMYCYEPVLMPAAPGAKLRGRLLYLDAADAPPALRPQVDAGAKLAAMARRRQARWATPEEATARLGAKPPFSAWPPPVLAAYVAHALRRELQPGGGAAWVLVTPPELEARYFEAVSGGAMVPPDSVRCPVLVAVGGGVTGPHAALPTLGRRVAAQLPAGRAHVFAGLDHFGPLVAPQEVAAHAASFFQGLHGGDNTTGDAGCTPVSRL